jgi:Tfp pilus assembly protein PilO
MKATSTNRIIIAMLVIAVLGAAYWMLALSPKREEASELGKEIDSARAALSQHRAEVARALEAREEFPVNYQQLVVLGKAVPGDDDTASLLVQLNRIGEREKLRFAQFSLNSDEGGEVAAPVEAPAPGSAPVSATEAAASTLPLGASIGPAGLAVMPYSLTFQGNFFKIADFIKGLDELVETENLKVAVSGRLLTVDGFTLEADPLEGFPRLEATFTITSYVTPPTEGLTGGATPSAPAPETATPASTSIGGTP